MRSFFGLRLIDAGRQLDNAWLATRSAEGPDALTNAMVGSQLLAAPLIAETGSGTLELQLTSFYPTDVDPPTNAIASLELTRFSGELIAETQFSVEQLKLGASWPIEQMPEGDHKLSVIIRHEGSAFALLAMTVSRVADFNKRLQELKESVAKLKTEVQGAAAKASDYTLAATLRDEIRLIENVIKGIPQEADFPLLHRLKNCEALLVARSQPTMFAEQLPDRRECWLSLASGRRSVPTRVHLPQHTDDSAPVLFVFHGAGGSENMFFETYGAGRVVREAAKRGWIVVSPRQGLFGLTLDIREMLNALEAFAPLDRKRIMLLGHSMGASQTIQQVRRNPELPVAAIALGGGGRMPASDAKRSQQTAWFIGAGDQDFGLSAAQQLNRSLAAAEISARFKVYDNVEHLVVVQAAIDDSFQFLDAVLAKLPSPPESDTANTR